MKTWYRKVKFDLKKLKVNKLIFIKLNILTLVIKYYKK